MDLLHNGRDDRDDRDLDDVPPSGSGRVEHLGRLGPAPNDVAEDLAGEPGAVGRVPAESRPGTSPAATGPVLIGSGPVLGVAAVVLSAVAVPGSSMLHTLMFAVGLNRFSSDNGLSPTVDYLSATGGAALLSVCALACGLLARTRTSPQDPRWATVLAGAGVVVSSVVLGVVVAGLFAVSLLLPTTPAGF